MQHDAARPPEYISSVAVEPFECIRAAWSLIVDGGRLGQAVGMIALLFVAMLIPYGSVVLLGPALCGIYYVMFKWIREEQAGTRDMFKGFEWMWESFAATLLIFFISACVTFPLIGLMIGFGWALFAPSLATGVPPDTGAILFVVGGGYSMIIFASMVVRILLTFTYPLIVDRGLQPLDAIKWSFRGARKHIPGLFALALLNGLIGTVGFMMCFIPGLLYMPIAIASMAFAHVKIYGLEKEPSYRTFETGDDGSPPLGRRSEWQSLDSLNPDAQPPTPISQVPEPAEVETADPKPEVPGPEAASTQDEPPPSDPAVPAGSAGPMTAEETVSPPDAGHSSVAAMREEADQEIDRSASTLGEAPTESPTAPYVPSRKAVDEEIERAVNPLREPPVPSRALDIAETRVMDGYPRMVKDEDDTSS
jgi:uncharacterized membrane protein